MLNAPGNNRLTELTNVPRSHIYDCVIVGGGIAGLQAAIQLGRFRRTVLVIEAGDGRSVLCRNYKNLLGWPGGISGIELRRRGREQAEETGVVFFRQDRVVEVKVDGSQEQENDDERSTIRLTTEQGEAIAAKRLLLSTGIVDRMPALPGMIPCLGQSIYVCPDCDGIEVSGHRTVVLGSGDVGAQMALTLAYYSPQLTYINHEQGPVSPQLLEKLKAAGIRYDARAAAEIVAEGGELQAVVMADGERLVVDKGFIAFGGNEVRSELAHQLGVRLHENKHILVDARTKRTSAEHVWAAGDVAAHSEQVAIAMGDGSQAAIWIHRSLLGVPVPEPKL